MPSSNTSIASPYLREREPIGNVETAEEAAAELSSRDVESAHILRDLKIMSKTPHSPLEKLNQKLQHESRLIQTTQSSAEELAESNPLNSPSA